MAVSWIALVIAAILRLAVATGFAIRHVKTLHQIKRG